LEESIKKRLRRIEGQVKGIQRMIDEDACCMDILVQISAIRAAVAKVGVMIFENHAKKCLFQSLEGDPKDREAVLADLLQVMSNFLK